MFFYSCGNKNCTKKEYGTVKIFVVLTFVLAAAPLFAFAASDEVTINNVRQITNAKALYKHYCQVCHGVNGDGNGPNAHNVDPPPADFTDTERLSGRSDKKLFQIISRGGRGAARSKNMPPWGATLSERQIWSIIQYIRNFSGTSDPDSPNPYKDEKIQGMAEHASSAKIGCTSCHPGKITRKIIAPDLGYERTKFNRNWLAGFLKKPIKIRPIGYMPFTKSRMPEFQFSDLDAEAIVEYLLHRKESKSDDEIMREAGDIDISAASAKKGKRLFRKLGCAACHKLNNTGGEVGPDLTKSAHRLKPFWVFKWLKNPQEIRPDAPMPNFELSDRKAKALVAYMLQVKENTPFPVSSTSTATEGLSKEELYAKGKELVRLKNCLGCHYMHSGSDKGYKELQDNQLTASHVVK